MTKPQIVTENWAGRHNTSPNTQDRIARGNTYKDLSTICIVPTRGMIPAKVVQSWMSLFSPMNQKFIRFFVIGMEVGQAYTSAVEQIIAHPELSNWPYILTLEEDNMPPPDGLLKLLESIDGGTDKVKHDAVGGLYWTKGEGGQPMCYGHPDVMPKNFIPFLPQPDTVQPCNGLGMGFTLFRTKIFKDEKIPRPWFRTVQEFLPGQGAKAYTQDLYFFENAGRAGYRFACDSRVKVGHYDISADIVW